MLLIIYNNEQFTFLSFRMLNINNKDVLGSANIIENMPRYWPPLLIVECTVNSKFKQHGDYLVAAAT